VTRSRRADRLMLTLWENRFPIRRHQQDVGDLLGWISMAESCESAIHIRPSK
jgi:hypothetical protein